MGSFINLMASDVWSEADIVNRTESMIASEFSPADVAILNRIATAAALGQYTLTIEEQGQIARYNAVSLAARDAGNVARADMKLLLEAMAFEKARAVVAAATPAALDLVALRNPPALAIEPASEPVPSNQPVVTP